ncbi:MAG: threonylcarbamoyl-AMP synthase [Elusimicrobiales bacterium]|nr:threonylcarbamoyl-AMP synthase [Elusimicrobiales bacterium]
MNIYKATEENIKKAASFILEGKTVAFPTETVYGLGADGYNPEACARIFEIKERPRFDPLILHADCAENARKLFLYVPEKALRLMQKFWPGPMTLVLPKADNISDIVTAGLKTVAVRVPRHPVALSLIKAAGRPVAAPSANKFGRLSPTTAIHVAEQLGDGPAMILDGGRTTVGVESTIITFHENKPVLLRAGGLAAEEIEEELGEKVLHPVISGDSLPSAPGCLKKHYAPVAEMKIIKRGDKTEKDKNTAYMAFSEPPEDCGEYGIVKILSAERNLCEAAANLFYMLHELEKAGVKKIYAEEMPHTGLGLAIMDRLKRGSVK